MYVRRYPRTVAVDAPPLARHAETQRRHDRAGMFPAGVERGRRRRESRLVVRAPNWLGDAVMALPAMAAVRAAFPDGASRGRGACASVAPLFEQDDERRPGQPADAAGWRGRGRRARAPAGSTPSLLLPNSFRSRVVGAARRRFPSAGATRASCAALAADPRRAASARARPPGRRTTSSSSRGLGHRGGRSAAAHRPCAPRRCARADAAARGARRRRRRPARRLRARRRVRPREAVAAARSSPRRSRGSSREARAVCVLLGAAGDRDSGRAIESSLPPDARVREPDRAHRPAVSSSACSRGARRSCRTTRARCTWRRRSACRSSRSSGRPTSA